MKKTVNSRHATKPSNECYYDDGYSDLTQYAQGLLDLDIPVYCVDNHNQHLCMNESLRQVIGLSGDDDHSLMLADLYSAKDFKKVVIIHNQVIETGVHLLQLESVKHSISGLIDLRATKIPLHNEENHIIGIASLCKIKKHNKKEKVWSYLQNISDTIPVPFYWLDENYRILGMNNLGLETIGFKDDIEALLGKTAYDMYPKKMADKIVSNQRKVMKTNKAVISLETIKDFTTGETKYYEATIAPLNDDQNNVIGTYGVSVEITAQKEAEELRLKDQAHQIELEQQEKFKRIVSQAVHDINSPLATMRMILSSSADKMPEKPRVALHQVASNIQAISGGLLENWSVKKQRQEQRADTGEGDASESIILVAIAFSELLTNKRFEYQKSDIQLRDYVLPSSYFTAIHGDTVDFKRMLSNLINNAAGAYDNGRGEIRCTLMDKDDQVLLCVSDKGKGIPEDVLNKIRQEISVSSGKEDGHGIGFTQIQDTVKQLQGSIDIQSTVGKGTQIHLKLPCIPKPDWLTDSLTVRSDDTIVVLDDDESIHQAWKDRFQQNDLKPYLDKHTVHFTQGQEAVDYINQVEDKDKLFLLTDYELLKQPLNGIQVIEQTGLKRTVLVTSHHDDIPVREAVIKVGTQLLPKQLAHEVPIHIDVAPQHEQQLLDVLVKISSDNHDLLSVNLPGHMFNVFKQRIVNNE